MKKKYIKIGVLFLLMSLGGISRAQQINPMTEAMLRGYNESLTENPKDYYTLYDRASLYMSLGNLDRALSDIDMALEYTPANDKDYRAAEFGLKAEILQAKKDYKKAILATNEALKILPSSQPDLYRLGNLFLLEKNGEGALKTFQQLQRENSRSQEAFYGMARAYVMLNRMDEANEMIEQIESLAKNSFITYCRLGDLYVDMNKPGEASANYIKAFVLDEGSGRPVESLQHLAAKEYNTVIEAIKAYQKAAPESASFPYLKALIAYNVGDYKLAIESCEELLSQLKEDNASVYRMMAVSQKNLGNVEDAISNIEKAETLNKGNSDILADKSDILLASDPGGALSSAEESLKANPDNEFAMFSGAKAAILTGNKDKALEYLNEILLIDPSNVEALLLRGFTNETLAKDDKAAIQDYTRAGNMNSTSSSVKALIALGKAKAGKKFDADSIIKEAIGEAGNDKDAYYNIAVYFAQTGDLDKAKEYVEKALKAGYSNVYNIKISKEPVVNLIPIQNTLQ